MKASPVVALFAVLIAGPALAGQVEDQVLAKEKALWIGFQKHDGELYRKSVTADSVQIITNAAPIVGRDAVVKSMTDPDCTLKSFSLSDEKAHRLAANVIMLTYVATQDGTCGKETLVPKIRSTAIYVQENGEWLERYYQETPAK
jgi:hypothetical protein